MVGKLTVLTALGMFSGLIIIAFGGILSLVYNSPVSVFFEVAGAILYLAVMTSSYLYIRKRVK
jgi:hypothetical protein